MVTIMHGHQTELRDRADNLNTAFERVQQQVDGLKHNIADFAATQNETMNDFRTELEGARALAAAFTDSLSSLSTGGIAALLDSFWLLAQGFGIIAVVILVDWLAGKTAARIVAACCLCLLTADFFVGF